MSRIFMGSVVLLIAACIPAVSSYYRPSASEGVAINDRCGAVAPASTMKFELRGVDVRLTGRSSSAQVDIRVPEGVTVQLTGSAVVISVNGTKQDIQFGPFRYYDRERKEPVSIPAAGKLNGKNETFALGIVEPRIFQSFADLPATVGERYTVLLPALRINGEEQSFPAVHFQKESGVGIYPVNC